MRSNPVEGLNFFFSFWAKSFHCLNFNNSCDDHMVISSDCILSVIHARMDIGSSKSTDKWST